MAAVGGGGGPAARVAAGLPGVLGRLAGYLMDVNARSHWPLSLLATPTTFSERIRGVLSQIQSTAGASSVIFLSISPHACARSLGSERTLASFIILFSS